MTDISGNTGRIRVAFVGGLDRLERAIVEAGQELGVDVEVHRGDVHGRGADALERVIRRADRIVVVTGLNSHGGVVTAKRLARRWGVAVEIVKNCGIATARELLGTYAAARAA
jgi:DNA invertase Pin-like site-specific DNA recombinase